MLLVWLSDVRWRSSIRGRRTPVLWGMVFTEISKRRGASMNPELMYQKLAQLIDAKARCIQTGNTEWAEKHGDRIDALINSLPSGSGIDSSTRLLKSSGERIVIASSYHAMDEHGFYDGWIEYRVAIMPSLRFGFVIKIVGNFGKRQDIKDYLYDIYDEAFKQEVQS